MVFRWAPLTNQPLSIAVALSTVSVVWLALLPPTLENGDFIIYVLQLITCLGVICVGGWDIYLFIFGIH